MAKKQQWYECVGDASGGDLGERLYGEKAIDDDTLKALENLIKRQPPAPYPYPMVPGPVHPRSPGPWTIPASPSPAPWTIPTTAPPWTSPQPMQPWRTSPDKTGWICPTCGASNSPGSNMCGSCNPQRTLITWCSTRENACSL